MPDQPREPGDHLRDIGLSEYESCAYIALLEHGVSTAKEVGSAADIPYSRVYDVLESLQKQGLVKIQTGRPKKYGAVQPKMAFENIIERKKQEHENELNSIDVAREQFIQTYNNDNSSLPIYKGIDIFWSYVGKSDILNKSEKITQEAEDHIYKITSEDSLRRIVMHQNDLLEKKHREGVNIKIICSVDELSDVYIDKVREFGEIRHFPGIAGRLYTYDDDRLLLAFKQDDGNKYVAISVRNKQMVHTSHLVFDLMWEKSEPI